MKPEKQTCVFVYRIKKNQISDPDPAKYFGSGWNRIHNTGNTND